MAPRPFVFEPPREQLEEVIDELMPPPKHPFEIDEADPDEVRQLKKLSNAQEATLHSYWLIINELRDHALAHEKIIRRQKQHIAAQDRKMRITIRKVDRYRASLIWAIKILNRK